MTSCGTDCSDELIAPCSVSTGQLQCSNPWPVHYGELRWTSQKFILGAKTSSSVEVGAERVFHIRKHICHLYLPLRKTPEAYREHEDGVRLGCYSAVMHRVRLVHIRNITMLCLALQLLVPNRSAVF